MKKGPAVLLASRGWTWKIEGSPNEHPSPILMNAQMHFQSVVLGSDPALGMKTLPKSQGRSIALPIFASFSKIKMENASKSYLGIGDTLISNKPFS